MNYNHDTEMDLDWAADQARRHKLLGSGLPDAPVRRVTATLQQSTLSPEAVSPGALQACTSSDGVTLGNALSALTINARDGEHCAKVCKEILAILADRDRIGLHKEFIQLKGVESILELLKHHKGEVAQVSLQILDKLSRTSPREIAAAGGIDIVVQMCGRDGQAPRVIESALKVLHGLTFDNETKLLLLRHGVRELAESIVETRPAPGRSEVVATVPLDEHVENSDYAWQDVLSIATRLLTRMGGARKGGLKRLPA